MGHLPKPTADNTFLAEHVSLLRDSYQRLLGKALVEPTLSAAAGAQAVFEAPFVVVSHSAASDPVFTYGNQAALDLFEMSWAEFTALPSKYSAEPEKRAARSQLLAAVARQGYAENYSGVRRAKSGRRFLIERVTVWNLVDHTGLYRGQAATYRDWTYLSSGHTTD
ncbi:MAG: MEKHLA domain-containing protein [Leptolyngbya sp. SIO4C1]|nr:MEKHLA domain-containing protein [Leptolyngbya sp. SIO4C1]